MILRLTRRTKPMGSTLFDQMFNGMPRSELYRSQVFPELFPHEKRMLIENWPAEDREMYCGSQYVTHHEQLRMKGIE